MSATGATTTRPASTPLPLGAKNGEQSGQTVEVGKTLAAKLANAAREIDRVAKRGHNKQQNYDFATAGDIFDEIRAKLAGQRVALHWTIDRENTRFDEVTSQGGSKGLLCTLWVTYSFIDGDDGSRLDYYTVGTANDFPGDKAVYKAQTNALKYLLMQTFLVSTGDDVEKDGPAGESATYTPRGSQPAARPSNGATKMSTAEQARIEALNSKLPTPLNGVPLTAMLEQLPYERALAQITMKHEAQCGANCAHVKNGGAPGGA